MLRRSSTCLGSYVLYDRVVCDWLQFHFRESQHSQAKEAHEKITSSQRKASSMSLKEAEHLIKEFTCYHNVDALSDTIKFIREAHNTELEPHHYCALLRVFVYNRDRENVIQLLEVIFSRGMMNSQTYASCIDALHTIGGQKELRNVLRIVELVSEQHREQSNTTFVNNLMFTGLEGSSSRTSPVMSSVLHHVCVSRYSPVAMMIVVTWMRALDVQMTMWDFTNVLSMLLGRSAEWPAFRNCFGYFEGVDRGEVTFSLVQQRCEEFLKMRDVPDVEKVGIRELLNAAATSLKAYDIDSNQKLDVGIANLAVAHLHTHVDRILEYATRFKGVGAERHNHATLYHTKMLMHHYLRQHTAAVQTVDVALKAQRQWKRKYGEEDVTTTGDGGEAVAPKPARYSRALEPDADIERSESFQFTQHFLLDAGASFDDVSAQTLRNAANAFKNIIGQLKDASDGNETDEKNMRYVAATGMLLLSSEEEWAAARKEMIHVCKTNPRVPAATKHQIKSYINMCARYPPHNPKMSRRAVEQREKWRSYLEARETALALFGSGNAARDAMKRLFYDNNRQAPARTAQEIQRDRDAFRNMFPAFNAADSTTSRAYPTPFVTEADQDAAGLSLDRLVQNLELDDDTAAAKKTTTEVSAAERKKGFKRMFPRVLRMPKESVPPHINNDKMNPFPRVNVKQGLDIMKAKRNSKNGSSASTALATPAEDPFPAMWEFLRTAKDGWYLNMEDMYSVLARCLIHRLDWEGLVQLTMNTGKRHEFNFAMDMEVNKAFAEAGDPCGALPFKIAAKLFDGRISDSSSHKKHLSTPNTRREKKGFEAKSYNN